MVSPPPLLRPSKFAGVLKYFDKYDYPLTRLEQIYWWSPTNAAVGAVQIQDGFIFLPGRQAIVDARRKREKISLQKWQIAKEIGEKLKKFSFIQAIFVTGSLAMNNAKQSDDIDLMVVTKANTLWITRFFVDVYLKLLKIRRTPPEHRTSVTEHSNRVCDNLWLDENHLHISPHPHHLSHYSQPTTYPLYVAHEIMQAKVLWDRNDIAKKFLAANAWVKDFLPNAYTKPQIPNPKSQKRKNWGLWLANCGFFIIQYLYMKSKMTTERVSFGSAFFHPNKYE